jgi:hypothetical protein
MRVEKFDQALAAALRKLGFKVDADQESATVASDEIGILRLEGSEHLLLTVALPCSERWFTFKVDIDDILEMAAAGDEDEDEAA